MENVKPVDKVIKILILPNGDKIISQIEEVGADIGEPDCKLIEPFIIGTNLTLSPWLMEYTTQNIFMISSEKILTLADPNPKLLNTYTDILK